MSALPLCQGTFSSGFETSNITSVGQRKSHSVPAPIVAGIILGVVFAVVLLTGAVIFALLRRRRYRQTLEIGGLEFYPGTLRTVELSRCELEGSEKCEAGWAKFLPPPKQQKLPVETSVVELHAQDIAIAELQSPVLGGFPEMPDSTTRASAIGPFGFWGNGDKNPRTASSSSGLDNIQRQSVSLSPHRSHPDARPLSYPDTEVQSPYSGIVTRFPIHQDDRTINGVMTCKPPSCFSGPQQRVADDGYQRNMSMASPDFISAHSRLSDRLPNLRPHFQFPRRKNSILQSASAILATQSPQTLYGEPAVSPLQSSPLTDIRHSISKSPMVDVLSQLPDTPPSSARLWGTFRQHYNIYDEVSSMEAPLLPLGSSGSFIEPALVSDTWEIAGSPRTMPILVSNSTVPIDQSDTDYAEFQDNPYPNVPFDLGELGYNTELHLPEEHNQIYHQDLFSSFHIPPARETTEQSVSCKTCGKQFRNGKSASTNLRRHNKEKHLNEGKKYLCPLCGKGYSRDSYRQKKHVCRQQTRGNTQDVAHRQSKHPKAR